MFAWWQAWQTDHRKKQDATVVAAAPQDANVEANASDAASPVENVIAQQETKQLTEAKNDQNAATTLQPLVISTDVMELTLDLARGGIITELKLPHYLNSLNDKTPVKLLFSDRDTLTYYTASCDFQQDDAEKASSSRVFELASLDTKLKDDSETLEVVLHCKSDHEEVYKTYTFKRGSYVITIANRLINQAKDQSFKGRLALTFDRKSDPAAKSDRIMGASNANGVSYSTPERPYYKLSFKELMKRHEAGNVFLGAIKGGWAALQQRYFLTVWIPDSNMVMRYFADSANEHTQQVKLASNLMVANPGEELNAETRLYAGPELISKLAPLAKGLDRVVEYGWFWIIANFFAQVLRYIHQWIPNWGLCIIVMTVLIKLIFYKLSENSYKSMARMKQVAPKLEALKQRYGDDKQALSKATIELYRKEGINPLGLGGCLPMLIQIPFFIAFYYVLMNAIEFRQAPFYWWIQDLASKDPYYVLPVLMGLSMWLQQKLSPTAAGMDETQEKVMMLMPVIFTVMFINFPSGLVLYWLVNNLLSVAQQWFINRKIDKQKTCK